MCGRYYIDNDIEKEMDELLEDIDVKIENKNYKTGEIFPTDTAPVLIRNNQEITPRLQIWGYPLFQNKGVIINARSETAFEKKTFRESLLSRRCIVPARGFFEWNKNKSKIYFTDENSSILYMAGLYNIFDKECRFVILTTSANSSISDVHNRMPLILDREQIKPWLCDNSFTQTILNQTPINLHRESVRK